MEQNGGHGRDERQKNKNPKEKEKDNSISTNIFLENFYRGSEDSIYIDMFNANEELKKLVDADWRSSYLKLMRIIILSMRASSMNQGKKARMVITIKADMICSVSRKK